MNPTSPKFVVLVVVALIVSILVTALGVGVVVSNRTAEVVVAEFNTFNSCEELAGRLTYEDLYYPYPVPFFFDDVARDTEEQSLGSGSDGGNSVSPNVPSSDPDFSETNVQVAGIDEADVVKTDGQYIYSMNGAQVDIFSAEITEPFEPIATVELAGNAQAIFISDGHLVAMGTDQFKYIEPASRGISLDIAPYYPTNQTYVQVFDVSDPLAVQTSATISVDGYYNTARLIDGNVYLVNNFYMNYYSSIDESNIASAIPHIAIAGEGQTIGEDSYVPMSDCEEISFFGDQGRNFVSILSLNVEEPTDVNAKLLVGNTGTVYMSPRNLYLTTTVYTEAAESVDATDIPECSFLEQALGVCSRIVSPEFPTISYSDPDTQIFRLSVDDLDLAFAGVGEVPGTLLNQFSLDENSGYLRVATTSEEGQRIRGTQNNLYVLDVENMQQVGELTGLARDERIYSVRYIGERAYVVTFRQVDPLFVIDLSDPINPEVMGELKIPGFSNYLHPYDQNYLLGFGQEADPDTGRTTGLKVGLFDVSDPNNPREVDNIVLGMQGSYSELLNDHKALLFDREKDLLVFPVNLYESKDYTDRFNGFQALSINTIDGFSEAARIDMRLEDYEYYYSGYQMRAFYIDDVLFLRDSAQLKALNLEDFSEIATYVDENSDRYYGLIDF